MPRITVKTYSGNRDAYVATSPLALVSDSTTLPLASDNATYPVWQFAPELTAGVHEIASATLRLRAVGAIAAGGSYRVNLVDWTGDLTTGVNAAATLLYASATVVACDAGEWIELDVTSLIAEWLAHHAAAPATLELKSIGASAASFRAVEFGIDSCAQLAIDFTNNGTGDPPTDPYTVLFAAVWDLIESSPAIAELVERGNLIRYDEDARDPNKRGHLTADYPQIRIVPTGASPRQRATSSSSLGSERFEIQCAAGDKRIAAVYGPLKWAVYRAISKWHDKILPLRYAGSSLVSDVRISAVAEGISSEPGSDKIAGWTSLWALEVEVVLRNASL